MMQNLLKNWKTTSAGILSIGLSSIHLIYQLKSHTADENSWGVWLTAVLVGVGLLFAGDSSTSVQKTDVTPDPGTGFLKKADATNPPKTP